MTVGIRRELPDAANSSIPIQRIGHGTSNPAPRPATSFAENGPPARSQRQREHKRTWGGLDCRQIRGLGKSRNLWFFIGGEGTAHYAVGLAAPSEFRIDCTISHQV